VIQPIPRSARLTRWPLAVPACIALSGCASAGASTAPSTAATSPGSASASNGQSAGGSPASTIASASPGVQTVKVGLTNVGCQPVPASVPAGPTNFEITNVNANLVFEMEVKQGDQILGERENVLPGMAVDPNLAASIKQQFSLLDAALARYGSGSSFALYGTLSASEIRTLAPGVDALAEPLSKVAVAISGCK